MADGINTTMKGMESMCPDAAANACLGDTRVMELRDRRDTVLSARKTGNGCVWIRIVALVPHVRN
jgi:hypothetical protein